MSRKAMQVLGMAPSICVFELKSVSLHSAFFDVALHASLYAEQDRGGVPYLTRSREPTGSRRTRGVTVFNIVQKRRDVASTKFDEPPMTKLRNDVFVEAALNLSS